MRTNEKVVYTIGHSNHPIDKFIDLLRKHEIQVLADVRSLPYSRFNPQFNMKTLAEILKNADIAYIFLGKELGGKPKKSIPGDNWPVDFKTLVAQENFQAGIRQILNIAEKHRLVLMCAEKEPLNCHRTILICRYLRKHCKQILHILADGSVEDHRQTERRLLETTGFKQDLFHANDFSEKIIERAYDRRAEEMSRRRVKKREKITQTGRFL